MSYEGIKRRGFASQDKARRIELARMGGKSAQLMGKSHKFSPAEAIIAGRKGGLVKKTKGTSSVKLKKSPGLPPAGGDTGL